MGARVQRLPPGLICFAVVAFGAVAGAVAAPRAHGLDTFTGVMIGMVAAAVGATALIALEPAWILTAALLLSVFSGNWGNIGIPFPIDRLALICGLGSAIFHALRARHKLESRSVYWLMGFLLLYGVVSAEWAGTLTQHGPLFALLDRLGVFPFAIFIVAPLAFREPYQRRILIGGLVLLGGYLGLLTLFEAVGLRSLVIPHYILDPALGIHNDRARGPFLEAGANGLAMYVCGVAATMLAVHSTKRSQRVLSMVVIVLCAAGILFTLTRQVWVGAAVGTLIAMLADRRLRRYLPVVAGGALVIVLVALAFIPGLSAKVNTRSSAQQPVWDRLNSDAAALRMVAARPALGFGWGTFQTASAPFYRLAATYPLTSVGQAHNVPLSNAAELGLAGFAVWLAILVMAIGAPGVRRPRVGFQSWRLGLIAIGVAWFVQANFTPLDYAFDNDVIWLFAAIVATGGLAEQNGAEHRTG